VYIYLSSQQPPEVDVPAACHLDLSGRVSVLRIFDLEHKKGAVSLLINQLVLKRPLPNTAQLKAIVLLM
jgi:hypothetical protein